jgi:hypothetical protein
LTKLFWIFSSSGLTSVFDLRIGAFCEVLGTGLLTITSITIGLAGVMNELEWAVGWGRGLSDDIGLQGDDIGSTGFDSF